MTSSNLDQLIRDEIEASERTVHYDPDTVPTQPGREAAKVYSVRLTADVVEAVERVAKEADVPTSTVIRGFIADGLAARSTRTVSTMVARLESDVQMLRGLVGNRCAPFPVGSVMTYAPQVLVVGFEARPAPVHVITAGPQDVNEPVGPVQ